MVREGVRTTRLAELPDFNSAGAGGSRQVGAVRVEMKVTEPARVPLAAHDELTIRHIPQAPRLVVGSCGENWFLRVEGNGGHAVDMTLVRLSRHVRFHWSWIELHAEIGVR